MKRSFYKDLNVHFAFHLSLSRIYSHSSCFPTFPFPLIHTLFNIKQQWVHAKKIGDGLEVYISEDSFDWMQIRQGDITDDAILQIGLYAASPESEDGFEATFEDFMVKGEDS